MKLFSKQTFIKIIKVVLPILIFLFLVNIFFAETFVLRTSQMSTTLLEGDRVLLSKLSYGPRIGSFRLYSKPIATDDVVLFNSPYQFDKYLWDRDLLVSRCVAQPGDTIIVNNENYMINGKYYHNNPNAISQYLIAVRDTTLIIEEAKKNNIILSFTETLTDSLSFDVSKIDASILSENKSYSFNKIIDNDFQNPIYMIVPKSGVQLKLTPNNINLYRSVLIYENEDHIKIDSNSVYISNQKIDSYTFKEDYYWFLSDNTRNSIDSKNLGFIPFSSVRGEVIYILYNTKDRSRFLEPIK